jgi:hypothetical protein
VKPPRSAPSAPLHLGVDQRDERLNVALSERLITRSEPHQQPHRQATRLIPQIDRLTGPIGTGEVEVNGLHAGGDAVRLLKGGNWQLA